MNLNCHYCGKEFIFKGGPSHFKRTKYHYCNRICQAYGRNKEGGNIISGLASKVNGKQDKRYSILCNVKKRAKQKGIEFNLTIFNIPEIPEYCPILGIKIKASDIIGPIDSSPSLDRINPKLGYIKGNIRIISNRANRIKSDATQEELKLIYENYFNI